MRKLSAWSAVKMGLPSFPRVKRRAARIPPAPAPATTSKKWAMRALGLPDLRRRNDSRLARAVAARMPSVAPPPSMERTRTFPTELLLLMLLVVVMGFNFKFSWRGVVGMLS